MLYAPLKIAVQRLSETELVPLYLLASVGFSSLKSDSCLFSYIPKMYVQI